MATKNEKDVGVLFLGICEVVNPRGKTTRFFNKFTRSSDLIYIYIYIKIGVCFVLFVLFGCHITLPNRIVS
jgi:hypothetical protein